MDTCNLIIDSEYTNIGCRDNISQPKWSQFYENMDKMIPTNIRTHGGQAVKINMFCNAAHATDLIMRRSTTDIIFFLFNTPLYGMLNDKIQIESSKFASEFVALRIASELNDAL